MAGRRDAPTPPRAWGSFGRRILAYWNETRDLLSAVEGRVTTAEASITTNTNDIAAIGESSDFTPVWTNVTMSSTTGEKVEFGDLVFFAAEGVISVVPSGFLTLTLPVGMHADMVGHEWGHIAWTMEDVSTGDTYTAIGFVATSTDLTARRADDAGQTGAWTTGVPNAGVAVGDLITVSGWYIKA